MITLKKNYTLKNDYIYLLSKLEENPPIFTELRWRSFFILSIFRSKFHFFDLFFSNGSRCEWRPCAIKFGADSKSSYFFKRSLGFSLIMMFGFRGVAGLSECWANEFICNQWERNTYIYFYRMFIGPCIIIIVEELETNLMSLVIFITLNICSTCFEH